MKKMEHKVLLVFIALLATAVWYTQESDSAIVRSQEEFTVALQEMLRSSVTNKVRDVRSADQQKHSNKVDICQGNACGWVLYKKFTRETDYFLKNTCVCPDETYKCVHSEDDLSISAYVYRCRQNTTSNDTEAPAEDTN